MKIKDTFYIALAMMAFLLVSFTDPVQKKKITDVHYRYEFYTTRKTVEPKEGRSYHWFKSGAIHTSEYGTSGELLHEGYEKFYLDNQIAEKGKFYYGQKEGSWKTWHTNGTLDSKQYWQDGRRHGAFLSYDTNGGLVEKGNFRKGKKHGKWINYVKKDTVVYKNDVVFVKKIKKTKEERKAAREEKKKLKGQQKIQQQTRKATKAAEKENRKKEKEQQALERKNNPANDTIKKGFFKRLFAKKEKQPNG